MPSRFKITKLGDIEIHYMPNKQFDNLKKTVMTDAQIQLLAKINNIDLKLLENQKDFLVRERSLCITDSEEDDRNTLSGIIHILDVITDYLEDK